MSVVNLESAARVKARHSGLGRGFTLIELVLVIIVVSVVAVAGIERLIYYQERVEKAAMDATLAAIKMGLQIRLAELIVTNRQNLAAQLERENPLHWLDEPPVNSDGDSRTLDLHGNWYFAADVHQLVYMPKNSGFLDMGPQSDGKLRFQVRLQYDVIEGGGMQSKVPVGIRIVAVRPYRWF